VKEALPDDVQALIDAERVARGPSEATRRAVRAKITHTLGAGGAVLKLVTIVLLVGGLAAVHTAQPRSEPSEPIVISYPAETQIALVPERVRGVEHDAPAPEAVARRRVPTASLLTRAWRALSAGEPARTLEIIDYVASVDTRGPLEEERRVLEISALAALGRRAEARTHAEQFLREYPQTIHAPIVARALEEVSR
jgi:hypothetical protein